ncbi:centrosomal protein of 85 kDa-like isoform X2 [Pangasianodon hypophthalmus]|uniref:centrosomal protein of 85 kDa-like isoform X2 n=1 Tax=Pangasianodon hypophthalmus TaxID=310915 RepID=UPI0023076107|nr:centrosomal protein of 85 kDa-like isoform X2 [Pangasianodon hypophthalmus]
MKSTEMWSRNDFEDGLDIYKAGSSASSPGWVPGCESAWHGSSSISSSNRARRHSAASDSADTGIGTSCSDSVEDHSSSSGTLSFQPLRSQGSIPTAHVMPSPSSSKLSAQSVPGSPWNSSQLSSPVSSPLDMKDPRPVRRWSSLTRLSGQEKSGRTSCHPDAHGSLDRSLLHSRADSSPLKPNTLDLSYSALPESRASLMMPRGHQAVGGSPIQPSVRTQMWLSEQMEFRPEGVSAWLSEQQQRDRMRQEAELSQMLGGAPLPVNTLVKIKEGLLRQRELEIDRQKQQIMQLHARIRENELRAQQVLQNQRGRCDDSYVLKTKESPLDSPASSLHSPQTPLCCENGELARRLASAELEVIHLKEFLKQNTQKYTEDIKKLEEKMKTRDRYISSLKKKCQREQEQNQEKQQRIETLEKYLADLPSLDEVHTQAQQLEDVQAKAQTLQDTVVQLERSLEESRTRLQEKDALIERQSKREKELVAAVQSLQEKVEKCLEDGVRLPMLDLKQLERENTRLLEQQSHNSTLIDSQKQQIDRLTLELTRLQKERAITQELHKQLVEREEDLETLSKSVQQKQQHVDNGTVLQEAGSLLKEMSLCLLDLKALCSILTQRAQGKEPNLALLLGIKSMSCSSEESEKPLVEDGLRAKLLEVRQLRKDIDELRTIISDRYAQDMGENCVTQ